MWQLPDWYGSSLVALLVVTLISLWADSPSYSYVFGSILNANAVLVLCAWHHNALEDEDCDFSDGKPKLPFEYINTPGGTILRGNTNTSDNYHEVLQLSSISVSTITTDSYESNDHHDLVSNFVSMSIPSTLQTQSSSSASSSSVFVPTTVVKQEQNPTLPTKSPSYISTVDTDDTKGDNDFLDSAEDGFFCWGFTIYYAGFFFLAFLVSTITFLQSCFESNLDFEDENSYFYVSNYLTTGRDWKQILFLLSFGSYVAACFLSYFKLASVDQGCVRYDIIVLSLCSGIASCLLASRARSSKKALEIQQGPMQLNYTLYQDIGTSIYVGEAWTQGDATILDFDNEYEYCNMDGKKFDQIPVLTTVSWGGEWACPSSPQVNCEATVQTLVSCEQWAQFQEISETDDVSLESYLHFRYHDYGVDDDTFYDKQQEPSFTFWNRPTESILGTCDGTCIAQSQSSLYEDQAKVTLLSHLLFACVGMSIVFLAWPALELGRIWKKKVT